MASSNMTSSQGNYSTSSDAKFGPIIKGARRNFDFTLLFEDAFLAVVPSAVLLLAIPFRTLWLYNRTKKVGPDSNRVNKVAFLASFAVLQLGLLLLWATNSTLATEVLVAAAALDFAAACGLCILSHYEHSRSVQPSVLINVYLLLSLIFDVVRTRTLWLIPGPVVRNLAVITSLSVGIKLGILILEAQEKRSILLGVYGDLPPEATSGIYNRSVFWWLNPLFRSGFAKILRMGDLDSIDDNLSSSAMHEHFWTAWHKSDKKSKHSLMITTFAAVKWELLVASVPRLTIIGFKYAQPFLLQATISYVSDRGNQPKDVGLGLVAAYALVYTGLAILTASYTHLSNRVIVRIRGGLASLIYGHTINLSITALDESSALTLMSSDGQSITEALVFTSELYGALIEFGIALFLLYNQLGLACAAPGLLTLLAALGTAFIAYIVPRYQGAWVSAIQTRVSFTSSFLSSVRPVKLLGLSQIVGEKAQRLRVVEVDKNRRLRVVVLYRVIFQNAIPVLGPVVTFAVFTIMANATGKTLSTANAFSALSVISLIESPLQALLYSVPMITSSAACFGRIQQFLLSPTRQDHRLSIWSVGGPQDHEVVDPSLDPSSGIEMRELSTISKMINKDVVVVKDGSFGWSKGKHPIPHNINIRIRSSSLVMVVGPVGCGKSTLVKSLIGETPAAQGFVYSSSMRCAFANQDGWCQNKTIRDSILGTTNYDAVRFAEVVRCCALTEDIRIFPNGERTLIGSRGVTLSGGQKQRVALARAVYADASLVILDDTFSGLDADTEEQIFTCLFSKQGLFRRRETTVILVTHVVHRLPYSDYIIALNSKGFIAEQGTYAALQRDGGYVQGLMAKSKATKSTSEQPPLEPIKSAADTPDLQLEPPVDKPARKLGDWQTYKYYFSAAGVVSSFLAILWCFTFQMAVTSPGLILNFWTASIEIHGNATNAFYMAILGGTSAVSLVSLLLVVYQVLDMVPRSSNGLHLALLNTVIRAPLSFFTRIDSGTTLNRFSQDITMIDGELPNAFIDAAVSAAGVVVVGGLMSASASYFLASIPIVLGVVYAIQKVYLRTSRQIRLLELEAKAPLCSHFAETLSGLVSIRAFGWVENFREQHLRLLDESQKPYYLLFCIQRWLQVVLDLLVGGLAVLLFAIVVQLRATINPGLVGLGLLDVMSFNIQLAQLIRAWTTLETSLGAISRLRDFVAQTESEVKSHENQIPSTFWPKEGAICIKGFSASYSESSDLVLKDITLEVRAGEKLGICGRSGSGKSSLLASLFHLLEYREGSISIDGQDLALLPRALLRQRLNCITQDPYWLGTEDVRFNIDPWAEHAISDSAAITALRQCQVWDVIEAKGGLNAKMDVEFLSHGQRQLFCLARAILRKSKVVVLDEVSASVDIHTDSIMQSIIREEFRDCTIISVAHRLETIVDFDRVACLSAGRIVECDSPQTLLKTEGSKFRELYET